MARISHNGLLALTSVIAMLLGGIAVYFADASRLETARIAFTSPGRSLELLPHLSSVRNDVPQLLELSRKIALPLRPTVVEGLHYWRLCVIRESFSAEMSSPASTGAAADCVTSADLKRSFLMESEFLKRFGSAGEAERLVTPAEGGLAITNLDKDRRSDGQSHPGQFLFYLSECNVALDDQVLLSEGTFRVADILRRELLFFDRDVSAAKTAPAFARYLAPQRSFSTWNHVKLSFSELMASLIQEAPESGWCHGTHRYYAVATLLHVDKSEHILSEAIRTQAARYLVEAIDRLALSQHGDGAWRYDWPAEEATTGPPFARAEWGDSVVATGHHLEWLFELDDATLRPLDLSIERARRFLRMQLTVSTPEDLVKELVPWCHAARSLLVWESRRPCRRDD